MPGEALALGAAALLAAGGIAARQLSRAGGRRRAARAGYLDRCAPLFDAPRRAVGADGLPRLSGRYGGALWDVQLVADSLSMRKLPALWLLVARIGPRRGACLTILRRPSGQEPFSGFAALPCTILSPEGFPEDCAIRAAVPPAARPPLAPLAAALDDPRVKELRLAASGLRLVWLAEEADRSRYLLFREAELARRPLAPAILLGTMARLDRLAVGLAGAAADERGQHPGCAPYTSPPPRTATA